MHLAFVCFRGSWIIEPTDEQERRRQRTDPVAHIEPIDPHQIMMLGPWPDLRHVPPSFEVVGITIVNFCKHFGRVDSAYLHDYAARIVQDLVRKYPSVSPY